ncbi:hypothetical protein VTN00DRAFT_6744 [Thermoascus crustaceus]|uniref:uncharacterized protein n=1 Tax=Thermoascus crustaceus TaxID=5088 RepID=UPI003743BEE8
MVTRPIETLLNPYPVRRTVVQAVTGSQHGRESPCSTAEGLGRGSIGVMVGALEPTSANGGCPSSEKLSGHSSKLQSLAAGESLRLDLGPPAISKPQS